MYSRDRTRIIIEQNAIRKNQARLPETEYKNMLELVARKTDEIIKEIESTTKIDVNNVLNGLIQIKEEIASMGTRPTIILNKADGSDKYRKSHDTRLKTDGEHDGITPADTVVLTEPMIS